jgi:pimeloyl-ACP methyl ester carboxylesterase
MTLSLFATASGGCAIDTSNIGNSFAISEVPTDVARPTPVVGDEVPGTEPEGDLAFLGPIRQVRTGDITIGYRQFGSGPPVVLVLGMGSTMAMWGSDLPRRLAANYQVTMYDLRGVGYSSDPATAPLTIRQMADDLAALLRLLAIERPTVVGWSSGGEIALALATSHPGLAGALVISGATPGGPRAVQPDEAADAAYRSGDLDKLLDLSFTPSGRERRETYVQQVLEIVKSSPDDMPLLPESVEQRQQDAEDRFATDPSVYEALGAVDVPTLVTNGDRDRLVPTRNAELIVERVPRSVLRIYNDSAHLSWFQDLDRFVSDIEQAAPAV